MWLTAFLALLIFIECVAVIYIPSYIENKLSKIKKSRFMNMENFENIASGAILSLAFIHMLPEAIILSNKKNINLYNIFTLILVSIAFLNITDILYDHDLENSFDINGTQVCENQSNSIKNIDDKGDNTNYVDGNASEDIDIEMKALDGKAKNDSCKNNFFFDMFKSNSFFIVLSLFIHSFIEGLLMGSLKDKNAVVIVGLSMIAHKWAECLIVYKNVVSKIENKILATIYAWSFILSLPLGVFIAIFSFPSNELVEIIFSSIACGFFLYLSFNMTKDIRITKNNKHFISFSYFLGVCGMSGLMLVFNSFEETL
ncbi:ZIP domain-containing protein, putative [Plasmodium gallinaceum]|uniref:ZIP domain-containing protein, putative n=1 Tax=Plasmodium gallinaceum TaxID=5849 RepID=A0A1J1H1P9_PLAGA|nr:ZIP domain-containing protein, putative [Plasmodium gallinaceum]CRG97237.1 ZIP domain-containing protein, putative [Plasmodium gallinaceum]